MTDCPFNQGTLDRLLRGETSPEETARLRAHLDEECAECESLFADLPETFDFLLGPEGREEEGASLSAPEKERILFSATRKRFAGPAWKRGFLLAASLVLAVSLFFLISRRDNPSLLPMVKDGDAPAFDGRVLLQFIVAEPDPEAEGGFRLSRGENDGRYPSSARLAFRCELNASTFAYLFRTGQDARTELIHPEAGAGDKLPKGTNDLMRGKELFQFPLEKISGVQTFCLAVFPEPPADRDKVAKDIAREIAAANNGNAPPRREGLDCFRIRVEKP